MMRRIKVATLSLTAMLFVMALHAGQAQDKGILPEAGQEDFNKTKDKLTVEQQILLRRFNEFQQQVLQLDPHHRIQCAEWLVHQQDFWPARKRARTCSIASLQVRSP